MPAPSDKTAWDFLPDGWTIREDPSGCRGHNKGDRPIVAIPADDIVVAGAAEREVERARVARTDAPGMDDGGLLAAGARPGIAEVAEIALLLEQEVVLTGIERAIVEQARELVFRDERHGVLQSPRQSLPL